MRGWAIALAVGGLYMVVVAGAVARVESELDLALDLDFGPDLELYLSLGLSRLRSDDGMVVVPGTRGFVGSLGTGPQRHSYDEALNRTTILDEVWLGRRSVRFPVAEYDGPPSRDVAPERVRKLDIPHSFLFVRRGGAYGEGTVVPPGRCVVEGKHEITLAPGEIAWVTVGPSGMTIDERDAP